MVTAPRVPTTLPEPPAPRSPRFTIRTDGRTDAATASGVPPVASCVEAILGRIAFPRPERDGAVIANATFTFTPT